MGRPKLFKKNQRVELEIEDLAFEGKGIARIENEQGKYIVFVPNTIPGQLVLARMIKVKDKFAEGKLLKVLRHSDKEVEMPYESIPGSPYITLPIQDQHFYKRKTSIELFRRIGKLENSEELLDEFLPSPKDFHYRNKMEYGFSAVVNDKETDEFIDAFGLGFKKRGQWLAIENLTSDSGLFDKQVEDNLPKIAEYFTSRGFTAWHPKQHTGFCRNLLVKKSFAEDALLINFTSSSAELEQFDRKEFKSFMLNIFGDRLAGLVHTVTDDVGDRPLSFEKQRTTLHGKDHIFEEICGLKFRISIDSFFQTNPASAERLYQKAMDYVYESNGSERPVVMDLFSGTGTITQLLAQRSENKEVIGVELVEDAVADARENARLNGMGQLKFFAADVGKFLLEHPEYKNRIDTVVMDPPRAGIAPKTLRKVIRMNAPRMVYISCNPATQARDMATLAQAGYEIKKYSLVDQFPHTAHIESVALFEKTYPEREPVI